MTNHAKRTADGWLYREVNITKKAVSYGYYGSYWVGPPVRLHVAYYADAKHLIDVHLDYKKERNE